MESSSCARDQQSVLAAADRVARAASVWIRHRDTYGAAAREPAARQDLVAGVILGLCEALQLDERHALLSAYAFFLIEGETADAFATAQSMFARREERDRQLAYRQGLAAAQDLVALLNPSGPDVAGDARLPI